MPDLEWTPTVPGDRWIFAKGGGPWTVVAVKDDRSDPPRPIVTLERDGVRQRLTMPAWIAYTATAVYLPRVQP